MPGLKAPGGQSLAGPQKRQVGSPLLGLKAPGGQSLAGPQKRQVGSPLLGLKVPRGRPLAGLLTRPIHAIFSAVPSKSWTRFSVLIRLEPR